MSNLSSIPFEFPNEEISESEEIDQKELKKIIHEQEENIDIQLNPGGNING